MKILQILNAIFSLDSQWILLQLGGIVPQKAIDRIHSLREHGAHLVGYLYTGMYGAKQCAIIYWDIKHCS